MLLEKETIKIVLTPNDGTEDILVLETSARNSV